MIAVPSYSHMGVLKADTGIRKPVSEALGVGKHDKTSHGCSLYFIKQALFLVQIRTPPFCLQTLSPARDSERGEEG